MEARERDQLKEYLLFATALLDSMDSSIRNDPDNVWKYSAFRQYMSKYNDIVMEVISITQSRLIPVYDMSKAPHLGNTIAMQQKDLFYSVHSNLHILKAYLENKIGAKSDEIDSLSNFLQVNLRRAVFELPSKEVQIQDTVEQLLIGRGLAKGVDYDRETGRVKISSKEVISDFIFPRLSLALEIKFSKDAAKSKTIIDEINADIRSYGQKYDRIIFLIYDIGSIRDETEFRQGLEIIGKVGLVIVKH